MTDTQLLLGLPDEQGVKYPASMLARVLGQPHPTPEQTAVIEAPLEPCVVIAGAGSGKTETMAARVVWLVANDFVRPEQILGLTFTRKAARELAARIRRRLGQLRTAGILDPASPDAPGDVTVSTYDAYAQRIVAEHALRRGHEPSPRLLTEAMTWQYADRVVRAYDGPMDRVDRALSTVIRDVVDLHGELSGHLADVSALQDFTEKLIAGVEAKPRAKGQRTKENVYAKVAQILDKQRARLQLLPLVEEFGREKKAREAVDFADQAELAARLADEFGEVGERERGRYTVVLLDEYQDTSHAQLVMLRGLFGSEGHAVTAVGDPCQSIYGWRGASALTLQSFGRHFRTASGDEAPTRTLATSFRNGASVLDVANVLSEPLRAAVPELAAHESTGPGRVYAGLYFTVDDEAREVAEKAAKEWKAQYRSKGATKKHPRPTIAILVRQRAQIDRIVHALRGHDLPVEVVGVGGLLTTPAVSDVVAALQVLADPTRGDALMRLLSGARWRIGPKDLDGLGRWARSRLPQRDADSPETKESEEDRVSIVDALDAVDQMPAGSFVSPTGRRRLEIVAHELRALRRRGGQSLVDLVADVIRMLRLDVEVAARTGDIATSRADLDAFLDVVVEFTESGESPTLTAFLAYLDAAAEEERGLETGQVEVDEDRVQVLTVHGAKGLEWDIVFVPGMNSTVFPAKPKVSGAWLGTIGALPYPLRGDSEALPALEFERADDQKEVDNAREAFFERCKEWAVREERRLAYVAVTRAKRQLVVSGYLWGDGARPHEPGDFLLEMKSSGACETLVWQDDPGPENPLTAEPRSRAWPYDPLDSLRRKEVEDGATLVAEALEAKRSGSTDALTDEVLEATLEWQEDVDLLLSERARRTASGRDVTVDLPRHLSVSQLVMLRRDPELLARAIRRPLPRAPNPLARRGTAFHAWLETRFGLHNPNLAQLLDVEELPGAADDVDAAADADLAALQEAFLRSDWAERYPREVEVSFELVVAGIVVRGRPDAVFATDDGLEVVDWKTGRPPTDPDDELARSVQLAAYRLAWAEMSGLPLEKVGAAFHYVRRNLTLRPVDLLDRAGLEALITSIPSAGAE